jgi:HK97 family phage prohead protease
MLREKRIVYGEVRAVGVAGKAMRVSGMAARYNSPTVIGRGERGSFKEVLLPGAFRKAVTAKQDTAFLINHDANKLMGRVSSGTLRLRDTDEGLCFDCDFPDTEEARSAYASIQRGDMHGCSFGFGTETGDDEWSVERATGGKAVAVRKIRNVASLNDVSAVTFPAYDGTSVSARFENRSAIMIPKEFEIVETEDETDSVESIARRRQLLNISLL